MWDRLPVCLATVPFAIGYERKGIPRSTGTRRARLPLAERQQSVGAVPETADRRGRVTIALHGYTHEDYPDGYEPSPRRIRNARLAHGLGYLRETLAAPITPFVPPHNALSKRGLSAVSGAGLNLLGSFLSFRPSMRPWDAHTLGNWWRVRAYRSATLAAQERSLRLSARSPIPAVLGVWPPQPDSRHDRRRAPSRL